MSSPITSASPITSVAPQSYTPAISVPAGAGAGAGAGGNHQLLQRLNLDLRGRVFTVDRETLMLLPESVLLGLFPQGLVLSKPPSWEGGDDAVVAVDFDPDCFSYILTFWSVAQSTFYGTPTTPGRFHAQQHLVDPAAFIPSSPGAGAAGSAGALDHTNPLLIKQAIIVLREELEYFSITPASGLARTDLATGLANDELRALRRAAGKALEEKRTIFTALQRNVNKENNLAEQHLIDMLCMSGFDRDDEWGYRACEPARNIISSMALVLLKTGISHPSDRAGAGAGAGAAGVNDAESEVESEGEVLVDAQQMATAQKLLLFWRKPARKCWWDGVEVDVPQSSTSKETFKVKVWARRVWTLELSLI